MVTYTLFYILLCFGGSVFLYEHEDMLWRAEVKSTGSRVRLPGFWF